MSLRKYVVSALVTRGTWVGRCKKEHHLCNRLYSKQQHAVARDPGPYFFNPEVQNLLIKLTGVDYNKVFSAKKFGKQYSVPIQRFMTKEQIEKEQEEVSKKASRHLQMPPVLNAASHVEETVTHDPELVAYEKSKLVFADISYGIPNHERLIVVREPTGELKK